ncbi:MAG: hypothetical protein ACREBS_01650 [Nitrososphaerales archaeon]
MSDQEIILAQEQSVRRKSGFGKEAQGTLVLTSRRLMFVPASDEEVMTAGFDTIRYTDVQDLNLIRDDSLNLTIPLEAIVSIKGGSSIITDPNIKVKYRKLSGEEGDVEFVQTIIGGRKKNLNNWAKVIEDIQAGRRVVKPSAKTPSKDTLEGRILHSLDDLQEKGVFEIENEIEKGFNIVLDPDEVEAVCEKLVSDGLIEKISESGVDFYRKQSPLGEDDLSS